MHACVCVCAHCRLCINYFDTFSITGPCNTLFDLSKLNPNSASYGWVFYSADSKSSFTHLNIFLEFEEVHPLPVASIQGKDVPCLHNTQSFILKCSTIQQQLHTHTHRATHSNGVAQDIYAELFTASHLMNTCCKFSFCLKLSIIFFIAAPNPKPSNNQPDKFASTTNNWLCLWSSYSSKQHRIHKCITKVAFHLLGKTS